MSIVEDPVLQRSKETIDVGGRTLPMALLFAYDTRHWDFRSIVTKFFGTDDLENLHLDPRWNPHDPGLTLPSHIVTRNSWEAGNSLHSAVTDIAAPLVKTLIYERIACFVGAIRSHQERPMLRVNFHGARSILRFHADREYGQKQNAINVWLPVTAVHASNSMYVESSPGLSDFTPVEMRYGEALVFYGTDLLHGTLDNVSGGTRISFDFRFSL